MMRKTLYALFFVASLLVFTGKGLAQGEIVKNEMKSEGKKRSYYLFVPKSVTKDKPAPLLVLFHGSGRNGRILIEHWQKLAEKESIILVGPKAQNSAHWDIPEDGPQFLYDII